MSVVTRHVVPAGLAAWLGLSFVGQHPNPGFDGGRRRLDPFALWIPNWRFFAPNPASADFQLVYRFRRDGEVSEWSSAHEIPPRSLGQALWFPERRIDKGLFDTIGRLLKALDDAPFSYMGGSDYILLKNFIASRLLRKEGDARGVDSFQFGIIRDPGYDPDEAPEPVFVSQNEPFPHELFGPLRGGATQDS